MPSVTSNDLALIVGVVGGLVGLLVITALMVVIVLSVVLVRRHKSATSTEQPFYDYVTPEKPPTLPERIQLKENEACGNVSPDTSQHHFSAPPLQPNIAYEVIKTRKKLKAQTDTPDQDPGKESEAYDNVSLDTSQPQFSTPPLQPMELYKLAKN